MASVDQTKVMWVKKGDVINGKKVAKGYLALRTSPGKAFTGTVTGIRSGTTTTSTAKKGQTSVGVYTNGRNVAATAKRAQQKSGSSAAGGIIPAKAGGTPTAGYKSTAKPKTDTFKPSAGRGVGQAAVKAPKPGVTQPKPKSAAQKAAENKAAAAKNAAATKAKEALNKKAKDALFNKNMKSRNIGYTPGGKK